MTRMRLAGACVVLLGALTACEGRAPGAAPPVQSALGEDAGIACHGTQTGCPCGEAEPEECYPDPRLGETRRCVVGFRYCREGSWSACEVPPQTELGGVVIEPLLSGPTLCNPCDPRCFEYEDQPTSDADIHPGNSTGVEYVPGTGIELGQTGMYMGSGDTDGDGVPDDFDAFPTDPTRDGFTENGGIFHVLGSKETAGPDPVSISTTIRTADIYVLMDATGSMSGEIANLRSSLTTGDYLRAPTIPVAVSGNETQASAYNIGTDPPDGRRVFTGNTFSFDDDFDVLSPSGCDGYHQDAVFRFTLTQTRDVVIESGNTWWNPMIAIHNSTFGVIECDQDDGPGNEGRIERTLGPGTYYVSIQAQGWRWIFAWLLGGGGYSLTFQFGSPPAPCPGGIIGAIRCVIPDAWFGLGMFREYNISPHGLTTNPVYQHLLDITGDVPSMQTAVNGLVTQGNADWPESLAPALFATATGNGLGTSYPSRAANPLFGACPAGRWGYPCFRPGTIPIVIGFTDAPSHEGPDRQFDYVFDNRWAAVSDTIVSGNDTEATAYSIGDITSWIATSEQRIYRGSTSSPIADNYNTTIVGCSASTRDAVFRFTLTQRRRVQLTTYDSRASYDTVLALFRNSVTAANRLACSDDVYFSGSASFMTVVLDPGTYYVVVDGNGATGTYYLHVNGRVPESGAPPYPSSSTPPYWEHTSHALRSEGIKFIGIRSCDPTSSSEEGTYCVDTEEDLSAIGTITDSVDDTGSPFTYTINTDGTGLSNAVVDAVQRLANYSRMDVSAQVLDNTATAFDEGNFLSSLSITNCPAARCSGPSSGSLCGQCLPGTSVGFEAIFHNTGVAPTGVAPAATAQTFDFELQLIGDGTYVLDSVPVRIVVPPSLPTYPESGSYWRDFDSTTRCETNERPTWGQLEFDGVVPAGTRIDLMLQVAEDAADLPMAPSTTVSVPTATSPLDISDILRAAGMREGLRHLRVTAVLWSDASRSSSPSLSRLAVNYTCLPAE